MLHPTWLADTLAGLMIATSIYCVTRLVAAQRWGRTIHRDTNVAHTADGVAMAGMLLGSLKTLPDGAWEIIFGALTVWCVARGTRFLARRAVRAVDGDHLSHYLSHLVMAGAMLYMFVEGTPSGTGATSGMSMMGASASSDLGGFTLLLVVLLLASAVWHADGLSRYTTRRYALVGAGMSDGSDSAHHSASGAPVAGGDTDAPPFDAMPVGPMAGGDRGADQIDDVDPSNWLAPRLEMTCHIILCITMGYMLILLL